MRTQTLTFAQAFGDVLGRVRTYRNLTPEQLAANSGVALSRILRFENGMTEPTLSEIFLLSRALRTTASSLMDGVDLLANGALKNHRPRNGADQPTPT